MTAAAAAARASPVAMGAKRATDNDAGVSSSSFAAADGQTSPGRGGDADDGADAAARIGRRRGRDRGGGKLPKKALKPLQTRLNDMRYSEFVTAAATALLSPSWVHVGGISRM